MLCLQPATPLAASPMRLGAPMTFDLDRVLIEDECRSSDLVERVLAALPAGVPTEFVADGREAARPAPDAADAFAAGKRRLVLRRRRGAFLMGCPAASNKFACCGYLVLVLASNCPMDCSYCFLQEYVADNPGLQIFTNYAEAFTELDRVARDAQALPLRIGTGELADSLAFDRMTRISADLVDYFAGRPNLTLELKTKTAEIDNLLTRDPKGRTLVSWSLSPERVFRTSEHRTAPPEARLGAARKVLEAGYKVAFHLDPIIAYDGAERDYARLIEQLGDFIPPARLSFISLGGLRMTPSLRKRARERFLADPMLVGEDVLSPDGRYRTFTPLRLRLYHRLREQISRIAPALPIYLCMETPDIHRRLMAESPLPPAHLGATLARA